MAKRDNDLSFTAAEAEALKLIVSDWLNEGLVTPPFDAAVGAVLKKLGLGARDSLKVSSETLEKMSEHAGTRPTER